MDQVKKLINKLNKEQKVAGIVLIIVIAVIVIGTITSNNSNTTNSNSYSGSTTNELKLTDEMISEIKTKVRKIDSLTETAVLKSSLGLKYNSVEIIDQDLTDAYTYTVYLKAIGVNKADYINYKIKYVAEEDKTSSKGYSIEKHYDFH